MLDVVPCSAAVAVVATLISESKLFAKVREWAGLDLLYCPICLSFWIATPLLVSGVGDYFLTLALANVWMLVILYNYKLLDETSE